MCFLCEKLKPLLKGLSSVPLDEFCTQVILDNEPGQQVSRLDVRGVVTTHHNCCGGDRHHRRVLGAVLMHVVLDFLKLGEHFTPPFRFHYIRCNICDFLGKFSPGVFWRVKKLNAMLLVRNEKI
jgi:hypothetical protein